MTRPTYRWGVKRIVAIAAPVGTVILAVLGAVWAASADRTAVQRAVEANELNICDHEQRLRAVERDVPQIATDVRWIRRSLEKLPDKK